MWYWNISVLFPNSKTSREDTDTKVETLTETETKDRENGENNLTIKVAYEEVGAGRSSGLK